MNNQVGNFKAVVPHDTDPVVADITGVGKVYTKKLYVGVAGDVTAIGRDGTAVLFKAMPVGFHDVEVNIVKSTGTAATNMVACY